MEKINVLNYKDLLVDFICGHLVVVFVIACEGYDNLSNVDARTILLQRTF
jgi:hypothetical protein